MTPPAAGAAAAPIDCYVYYRVGASADARALAARVRAMQAALARRTGVRGRLLRRADDASTWMECYDRVPAWPAFAAALDEEVAAHGLAEVPGGAGMRQLERFVELA